MAAKGDLLKADTKTSAKDIVLKYGIVIALIILIAALSVTSDKFFTVTNFITILNQTSINALLAVGVTFVILTGGIDLSVGSVLAVSGVAFAMFAKVDDSGSALYLPIVAVLVCLITGLLFGLLNGFIVAKAKVAPFIVTLGTMTVSRGVALIIADGRPVSGMSPAFKAFGSGNIGGIPYLVIIMVIVSVIAVFVLGKTKFGRYIYAVGGNEEAARASGISAANVKMAAYAICGFTAGLAGLLQACRVVVGQPNAGEGYELQAISAVVIGGTALSGGIGKMWGTIVGAFIIGVLNNGLDLLGVSSYWQKVISGAIIIAAVLLDRTEKK